MKQLYCKVIRMHIFFLVVSERFLFSLPEVHSHCSSLLLVSTNRWEGPVLEVHDSQTSFHSMHAHYSQSDKSDWLRKQNELSAHAQKIGPFQTSQFLVLTKMSAASGDKNERFREQTLNQNEILVCVKPVEDKLPECTCACNVSSFKDCILIIVLMYLHSLQFVMFLQ